MALQTAKQIIKQEFVLCMYLNEEHIQLSSILRNGVLAYVETWLS